MRFRVDQGLGHNQNADADGELGDECLNIGESSSEDSESSEEESGFISEEDSEAENSSKDSDDFENPLS